MKIRLLIVSTMLSLAAAAGAQQLAELRQLIDMPTAGVLDRGSYAIQLRMFGSGGLLGSVSVGLTPRVMFGLSFGGENVIGEGDVDWNGRPGILAKVRIIDENFAMPAITAGFESQGYGPWNDTFDRYQNKSRGLYAVASKNYAVLFNLGIHGGLNYSFEDDDNDDDLNIFLGVDLSFNREFRTFLEYDFANNDNQTDQLFGSGDGYLNAGAQWTFSDRLFLRFNLKNLLEDGRNDVAREIKIGYFEYF